MPTKRALLLAYVFPPFGSVGSCVRVVKFVKYLGLFGWKPTVLTIADNPDYQLVERSSSFLLDEIPASTQVVRTKTWQPSPRLARTHNQAATPESRLRRTLRVAKSALLHFVRDHVLATDEYLMWFPFAVRAGCRLNRETPFDIVFVTVPPFSVALAGWALKTVLGKPLVLDVRDDWVDSGRYFAKGWHVQRLERWLERRVVWAAERVVLVTDASQSAFRRRYPQINPDKFVLIPNGCDLSEYEVPLAHGRTYSERFTLLHSGVLPRDRNPESLLQALHNWLLKEPESRARVRLVLVGNLLAKHAALICALQLDDIVEVRTYLAPEEYRAALRAADVLLAIAYERSPTLIPGKLYEYWAATRPILLLAEDGAAKDLVLKYNLGFTVSSRDTAGIEETLRKLYQLYRQQNLPEPDPAGLVRFDRRRLTQELAALMEETST